MKKILLATSFALVVSPAIAKDVALILSDDEQKILYRVLDAATRGQGIEIAPATAYLLNKLRTAGTVTERKDDKPEEPPTPKQETPQ